MSRYTGPSEAQGNAEALARREAPYTAASEMSFRTAWDYHRREPADLREAVRMVRRAYADEVPHKLHDGPDAIGLDGTPRMTARAEGYIFGHAQSSDRTDPDQLVSYYHAPFRATLERYSRGNDTDRLIAAIVGHITIGQQGPKEAVIAEGIPSCAAGFVAGPAIRAFLRGMSDMKLHLRREADLLPEGATAA